MKRVTMAAVAAALILVGGCRSRQASDIPPEALGTNPTEDSSNQDSSVGGTAVPGSRADFMQNVPSDRVFFALDSYSLDSASRTTLEAQATWLARYPNVNVTIEGHADERGTREYNLALGDRRANAARAYLESRGVASNRMQVISWGKERPQVAESNEAAWAQNRRAVTVLPQ